MSFDRGGQTGHLSQKESQNWEPFASPLNLAMICFIVLALILQSQSSYPFSQADLDEIETETKIFQDLIEDTDQVNMQQASRNV